MVPIKWAHFENNLEVDRITEVTELIARNITDNIDYGEIRRLIGLSQT